MAAMTSSPGVIRAARGTELSALSWQTEAPLRMLMNNLDPEVAEHPEDLVVYGGTGKAARDWPSYHAHRPDADHPEAGRDPAGAVGPPGRGAADPRVGAPGADRQLQPGRRLGELGGVPPAGAARADHVRPDDRRLLDLHRHPGHPAGHLRDLRRGRGQEVQRHAGRHHHPHRGPGRDGRRAAAGGHHERRGGDLHRVRPEPNLAPDRTPLPRRAGRLDAARAGAGRRGPRRPPAAVDRAARQRRVAGAAAAGQRRPDRHRHRPDLGARPAGLPADRGRVRRHEGLRRPQAGGVHRPGPGLDGPPRRGDGGFRRRRRRGVRLRQLDPRRGAAGRLLPRLRLPRLRARLHPAAVRRGQGPVPVGGAVR